MPITIDVSGVPGGMAGVTAALRNMYVHRTDPSAVELKNKPTPYTGPEPRVTIPLKSHPHIVASVISFAGKEALLALRAACKLLCALVDRQYACHIEVSSPGSDLDFTARWLGRIPSFRFRGAITLGVSYISDDMAGLSEVAKHTHSMAQMNAFAAPDDIWLRVRPEAVEWFTEFMRHVKTVDMGGSVYAFILPLSRKDQVGKDPYGRVFLDPFPVQHIRMYPGNGGYANFVPFTCKWVSHSLQLDTPDIPPQYTWLHQDPRIPEGTTQLAIGVHLHPNLPPGLSAVESTQYPSSLKLVAIELKMVPDGGNATSAAFLALANFWTKVFAGFRPGMQFLIFNIHQWDNVPTPMPLRDFLILVFCTAWKGTETLRYTFDQMVDLCSPHIRFVRGQFAFSTRPLHGVKLNPDGTPNDAAETFPLFGV